MAPVSHDSTILGVIVKCSESFAHIDGYDCETGRLYHGITVASYLFERDPTKGDVLIVRQWDAYEEDGSMNSYKAVRILNAKEQADIDQVSIAEALSWVRTLEKLTYAKPRC